MKILKVEKHSLDELVTNLRRVELLNNPDVKPYLDARIESRLMVTEGIRPAQRYLLEHEIQKITDLEFALFPHNIDLFDLQGYLTIYVDGFDQTIDVLPPIVELSHETSGPVNLLNDGMHRVWVARTKRRPIRVAHISGVDPNYPYYALPLADGWNDVQVIKELYDGFVKKYYRVDDPTSLYRNFNSAFTNVGAIRQPVKPT